MPSPPILEGIWQPVYAELGGEEAPKMALEKMEIELRAGEYAVRFAGLTACWASQATTVGFAEVLR